MHRDANTGGIDATAAVAHAPVLFAVLDTDAHLRWCNERWSEITGRSPGELANDGWFAVADEGDVGHLRSALHDALAAHTTFAVDVRLRRHDGRDRWYVVHGGPIDEHDAEPLVSVVAVDVTDERESERTSS